MPCSRLVGLEKGNCAFVGCFLMSAAGGFVYIYTRTRTRKGLGSARLAYSDKFRKQNKAFPRCLENKTRSVMFRKQNKGRDEKTVNGFSRSAGWFSSPVI